MAEVRRRSTRSGGTKTASRRRDRVNEEPEDDDEDDDVDATPPRTRRTAAKSTTRRRRPEPVDEDEDDDEEEEPPVRKKRRPAPEPEPEDDDEDEDEDEDEEPPPRRKRRRPAPVEEDEDDEDDEDDDEDEEPAPKRSRAAAAKKASPRARKAKLPPGIRTGVAGVEATAKAGGGGEGRITLDKTPILVKILEPEPLMSFRQHWLSQGKGQGQRAYVCIGKPECPVCKYGDRTALSVVLNVLNLSVEGEPANEYLQIGKRAWDSLSEQATGNDGVLRLEKDFWSVNKTGKGTSSQTNFRPVKQRDIKEDWPEVLEDISLKELPDAIEEAKENLFDTDIIQVSTKAQLREVSKYLAEDDDEDDDD
jgi:hypothetical protein